jgi:hypothetical protein
VGKARTVDEKLTDQQLAALIENERGDMAMGAFLPGTDFSGAPIDPRPVPRAQDIAVRPWEPSAPSLPPVIAALNVTVHSVDVSRLENQHGKIIRRLREGRATNGELCALALKYNARISELRQAGYIIECVEQDHETGVAWYELKGEPDATALGRENR